METVEQLEVRIARLSEREAHFRKLSGRNLARRQERAMRKNAVVAGNILMARLQAEDKLRKLQGA